MEHARSQCNGKAYRVEGWRRQVLGEQYHMSDRAPSHGRRSESGFEGSKTRFTRVARLFLEDSIQHKDAAVAVAPIGSPESTTEITVMGMQVKRSRRPDCPMSGTMGLPL
jgi:hypothetical protein